MTKALPPAAARGADHETAIFGSLGTDRESGRAPDDPDFTAIANGREFRELRKRLLRFVFPMSAVFFVWYLVYVLLSAYDHPLMSRKVVGAVNIGTLFGLLEFVSTMVIVLAYTRFARRKIDPVVAGLREQAGMQAGVAGE